MSAAPPGTKRPCTKSRRKGNGPHEPTDESSRLVKKLVGLGLRQEDVCGILEISKPTLEKHYRTELDCGMAVANAQIAEALFKSAKGGNVHAQIFWLKVRANWIEPRPAPDGRDGTDHTLRIQINGGLPDL